MPFYKGMKFSEEHKKKLSEAKKGKYTRENHSHWKGGRYKHDKGYVYVLKPDHPYTSSKGYVFEHRLVMEQHLGRYLIPNIDDIHHINGIKNDNRIENLQLFEHGTHSSLTHRKYFGDEICSICGCKTLINKKTGRPMWHYNLVCKKCYDKKRKVSLMHLYLV